MKPFPFLCVSACVLTFLSPLVAETPTPALVVSVKKQIATSATVTVPVTIDYLEALPEGYSEDETKRWPVVVFLHGINERGTDVEIVARNGLPRLVEEGRMFPFILLSPQCPSEHWWEIAVLDEWLDNALGRLRVDRSRVYLTGLSMGGYGTWWWAQRSPDRFAAIVPICGGGNPEQASKLKDLPIWAFHGAKDAVVPPERTKEMVAAIEAAGGEPRLTIYPEAEHDSWTQTYANDEVFTWLLSHRRKQ